MRTRSIATLLVLVATVAASWAATVDPSGFLMLTKPTVVCKDFDHLMIENNKGKYSGWLQLSTNDKQRYKFSSIAVNGTSFTFKTAPDKKGVSYSFSGKFIKSGNFAQTQPSDTVLTGKLMAWAGKRMSASQDVSFTYTVGD